MTGFTGNGEGGITQGATENIFSVSNATSWVKGHHNVRFGIQAQFRKYDQLTEVPPRGGFTFNGQFTGNPVADFLLGYCSTCTGAFGSSRSNYSSPTFAPFIDDNWQVSSRLTLQMGLRWEYLGPWHEKNNQEGSFDPVSGKIGFHVVPTNLPASLVPLIINQNDFFPSGILKKDLNNFGPRVGVVYSANDTTVVRTGFGVYYDNLNLNELQFSRLVPPFYGQYSLQPVKTDLSMNADTLFPDLNNIPVFPAPFSMNPDNRTAYTFQWNGNVQHTFAKSYLFEVAYTGSHSYNEHKRYNINQATPGTTPIVTRVPYPAFQSAILYSSDAGWAEFNGLTFRLDKRYSDGLFFLGSYQLSKSTDNGSGEIEANDTAFATNLNADQGYARYDQRHRVSASFGYELPFGPGKRWLSSGGAAAYVFGGWQVQSIIRLASGFPFTITSTNVCQCGSFVPQRVNLVTAGNFGQLDNPTVNHWFDPDCLRRAGARHAGQCRPQHGSRPRHPAGQSLVEQTVPDQPRPRRVQGRDFQPAQPRQLRHAGRQYFERHGRRHHHGRRWARHAVRTPIRLVVFERDRGASLSDGTDHPHPKGSRSPKNPLSSCRVCLPCSRRRRSPSRSTASARSATSRSI